MTEDEIAAVLAASAGAITVPPAPVEAIVALGRRRVRARRAAQVVAAAAAVVAVAVLVPMGVARRGADTAAPSLSCVATVPGPLPEWARSGFSDPEPVMPYVLGDGGAIAAVPFGPLTAPPTPGQSNKILWVARDPQAGGAMTITARPVDDAGAVPVTRDFPDGVGPSVLDLPSPGCWALEVRWPGHSDTLRVRYSGG